MELDLVITNFFGYFLRFVAFLILVPIAGGMSSFVTKFVLSFLISYFIVFECEIPLNDNVNYLNELMIGVCFSIKVFMKVYIAVVLAEFFDAGRGANSSYVLNPTYGESQSYMSIFAEKYVWLLWLVAGGLEDSTKSIIQMTYFNIETQIASNSIFNFILQSLSTAFQETLPFLFIFFLCDLSLCFMAKIFNKWQIYTDIFSVKTFLGFGLLLYFINS